MKPSLVFMIRLSGSVKLRCALSSGTALGGGRLRPRLAALAVLARPWPAAACASASSAALASRILASRRSLLATQSGSLVAAPVSAVLAILGRVLRGRLLHPSRNLGGELLLGPSHPAVAHRLVLGGIRLDLGAVERDMAELD